ncbi:DUF2384 domain-containing protein [bacterium]|nr:MAG: DUF2384 domain-containing protein [bacterium]
MFSKPKHILGGGGTQMAWSLLLQYLEAPTNPGALSAVQPLLARLVEAYGIRPLARLLGVGPGTVANWNSGRRRMSAEMTKRVIDLHDILNRALQVFPPDTAARWLVSSEPFLDHHRPIDVLALRGAAPLIEALEAIDAGAYA